MVDIASLNAGSLIQQSGLGAASKADASQVKVQSQAVQEPVKIPEVEESEIRPQMEERRFAKVTEAAKQIITDFYPISDTRFTIFKDGSGQYITRVTNMRDGTMTLYPEATLLSQSGGGLESFYQTNA